MNPKPILPGVPLLLPLVMLVAGISAANLLSDTSLFVGAALLVLAVTAGMMRRRALSVAGFFACVGIAAMLVATPSVPDEAFSGRRGDYRGCVSAVNASGLSQRIIVDGIPVLGSGKCAVMYADSYPAVEPGDTIAFNAEIQPVEQLRSVPDEITDTQYLKRRGVVARCRVSGGSLEIVAEGRGWRNRLFRWRESTCDFIYSRMGLTPAAASMLQAVFTGDAGGIDRAERSRFATAGVAHVLALSGMHVAVLAFIVSLFFFPLRLAGHRRMALVATMLLVWGFALFSGLSASVVRAAVMATVVIAGQLLRRGSVPLNNLCFAAILILVFDPQAIFSAGFQLSFVAVASILLFAPFFRPAGKVNGALRMLLDWIVVSVCAVAGTGVLAAFHFHEMPLYFILANIPVGLMLPLFMGAGMLEMVLVAAGVGAGWLGALVNGLYAAMAWCVDGVAALPEASLKGLYFSGWWLLPYYAALAAVWLGLRLKRAVFLFGAALIVAFMWGLNAVSPQTSGHVCEAWFIEDDFATSLLLRDDGEAWILTDAKPKFHAGMQERLRRRLKPFCAKRGIDSVQVVRSVASSRMFYADSSVWIVGNREFLLAGKAAMVWRKRQPTCVSRYLVLTAGFKGDAAWLAEESQADSVIVSPALYPDRAAECEAQLDSAGIAHFRSPAWSLL